MPGLSYAWTYQILLSYVLMHLSCHWVTGTLESMCGFLFLVSFEKFSQIISFLQMLFLSHFLFCLLSGTINTYMLIFSLSNRNPNLFFNFLSTFFSPYFNLDIFSWPSFQSTNPLFSFLWLLWNLLSFNLSHCMFYFYPRVRSP